MRKPEPPHLPRFGRRPPGVPTGPQPGPAGPAPSRAGLARCTEILHKLLTGAAALATILRFLL